MPTPLHDVDALVHLAQTAPPPAASWASSRLAVIAPDRFAHFPTEDLVHDVVIVARPPRLQDALIEALVTPPNPGVASAVAMIGRYGALPADPGPLHAAVRGAIVGDGRESDLWLGWALTELGTLDDDAVRAVARAGGTDREWVLTATLVRHAAATGDLSAHLDALAQGIAPRRGDPRLLAAVLGALGAPVDLPLVQTREPVEAARNGATLAGAELPVVSVRPGSRKRRVSAWVDALLDGVDLPEARLLATVCRRTPPDDWWIWAVTLAAWLHCYTPADPVDDVTDRSAGARATVLSAARRQVTTEHAPAVAAGLIARSDLGCAALAIELDDEDLATTAVDAMTRHDTLVQRVASAAVAWRVADRIPGWLGDPRRRRRALTMAEWAPTEEVLVALLGLDEPADPAERVQFAAALAAMGDRAALVRLEPMLAADVEDQLGPIRELVQSLFPGVAGA